MSIKKIAELAHVSPSTVSRVLNNPDYKCSSPALRDEIWRIAMELDYTPNEAARSLRMGGKISAHKTSYINVLMTRTKESEPDPFFAELLNVISSEIHRQSGVLANIWYMPLFSDNTSRTEDDLEKAMSKIRSDLTQKCDGLIVIGRCNSGALKKLGHIFSNIVAVNRNSTEYEVDEVICDGFKIASMAADYLIGLGHRDIAYVGECRGEARYRGYIDALGKSGIKTVPEFIVDTKQTRAAGYETMKCFLKMEKRPTGIYCANDILAIGMLECLEKYKNMHYKPSVIASDDIEEAGMCRPMLTTVRLPKEDMGRFAVWLIMDRIQGGHSAVTRMEFQGKLMIRESCAEHEDL